MSVLRVWEVEAPMDPDIWPLEGVADCVVEAPTEPEVCDELAGVGKFSAFARPVASSKDKAARGALMAISPVC
ncbi:MAG TPA: hypothetical protein VJU83_07920 [Burkholderiales bacterium]|nr:hypothetical protein [Burkholderiales bacterium]